MRNDAPLGVGVGDDGRAGVIWWPIGLVRAMMLCNFLPSQMLCAAVPILPTGNGLVLKHADNVQPCAHALVALAERDELPTGLSVNILP